MNQSWYSYCLNQCTSFYRNTFSYQYVLLQLYMGSGVTYEVRNLTPASQYSFRVQVRAHFYKMLYFLYIGAFLGTVKVRQLTDDEKAHVALAHIF